MIIKGQGKDQPITEDEKMRVLNDLVDARKSIDLNKVNMRLKGDANGQEAQKMEQV